MNKIAKDLIKIADDLKSKNLNEEAWDLFFIANRIALAKNPLMKILGDLGFEPSEVFEYGDDDIPDSIHPSKKSVHRENNDGVQEIWMQYNPETKKIEYGYMHEGGKYGHKHAYYDNIEDLISHIVEEDEDSHPCKSGGECNCGGSCRSASSDKKKHKLNKPFRTPGGPKKFSVYVRNEKGNVVKVNFGDPNLSIKRDQPGRRKNFRARHHCENPGPKTKAKYWSCKMWSKPSVTNILKGK